MPCIAKTGIYFAPILTLGKFGIRKFFHHPLLQLTLPFTHRLSPLHPASVLRKKQIKNKPLRSMYIAMSFNARCCHSFFHFRHCDKIFESVIHKQVETKNVPMLQAPNDALSRNKVRSSKELRPVDSYK